MTTSVVHLPFRQTMFNFRTVSEVVLDRKRNFCKNSARATILYVKHLHLWRRMSCQAYVQVDKVGTISQLATLS